MLDQGRCEPSWPERLGVAWGPSQRWASGLPAFSPVRLKLSGMLLLRPHLLFGRYHMLEEGQDPSHKQRPQR